MGKTTSWTNWARTERAWPVRVERPDSVGAVQRLVRAAAGAGLPIKAVGAGHSFTGIAVAPGVLLELDALSGLVRVDRERNRVTLRAGTRLHDIPRLLEPYGLAMPNLGDIDRQSVAGAISTGTHGTGMAFGGIATQVVGVTMVTAEGELLTSDAQQEPGLLPALALGLGALGILVEVTLQCVPAFVLHAVERPESLDELLPALLDRAAAVDHFEFYWFPHTATALTKTNHRLPGDAPTRPLRPVAKWVDDTLLANGVYRVLCNTGVVAPATVPRVNRLADRLVGDREFTDRSTRVFTTSRTVRFVEMEYAVPLEHLPTAFARIRALIEERGWRISFPIEVRVAAADELWLSTASGRATGYVAVHRFFREDPGEYFRAVEAIMIELGGRPHWGKLHGRDASSLRGVYPRFDEFVRLRDRLDPGRLFGNRYLARVLGE
ncbi:FAD-binding protein [Plantibacter sp. PA-3-X8]|uniref:D-arabinono-1,4-lactone oxidase n=1 Tax=unclassified Plantibacter TaxID=2624265 RepID=UPI000F5F8C44|nr:MULTISPECIES: D-arabinono-1,4-lactone oxidase [unclassified Plantibacter]AZH83335.1 FAD-binding protein [Plantibacter sp. PA-3-X8]MBD8516127.1 FAD-binding protein [Plantibacter sp. CFBP 8804]